ncbi:MAG TPA: hypothetical protein VD905_17545 [Flavobacteriales bacterium]|nr:hypothetical protein [Flavobacteriales bacterium]
MVKKLCLILFAVVCFSGKAKSQFVFDFLNFSFGMFQSVDEGGYEGRITFYNNSPASLHGLKGVWHVGERFKMGYTLHYGNNVITSLMNRNRYRMLMLESGLFLEYIFKRYEKWYFSIPLQVAGGTIYIPKTYVPSDQPNSTQYFSVEPRVQVNKPVLNWFQLNVSVGYRIMSAGPLYGTNSRNLAGPSFNFGILFGSFK